MVGDFDGDLVLVVNEPLMRKGVHPEKAIVMDIDDKITSLAEEDTKETATLTIMKAIRGKNDFTKPAFSPS